MPYKDPEVRKRKNKERRQANLEKYNEKMRSWRAANPERTKEINRLSRKNTPNTRKNYYALHSAKIIERVRRCRVNRFEQYLVRRIAKKASLLGIDFDLDESDIFIPEVCPALGIPLIKDGHGQRDDIPSLDRVDSRLGYVKGNVQIISMKANRIKNDATYEELEKVALFLKSRSQNARHS